MRQGIQSCLALAPVVFRAPIARKRLSRRELNALGCICHRFPFRPLCVVDAPTLFGEFRFRGSYFLKRTNRIFVSCERAAFIRCGHGSLLCGEVGICNFCPREFLSDLKRAGSFGKMISQLQGACGHISCAGTPAHLERASLSAPLPVLRQVSPSRLTSIR